MLPLENQVEVWELQCENESSGVRDEARLCDATERPNLAWRVAACTSTASHHVPQVSRRHIQAAGKNCKLPLNW